MTTTVRDYVDFWTENNIHAVEEHRAPGGSQNVSVLVNRLVEGALGQGITRQALESEIGDLACYIQNRLADVNQAEHERRK
ncbi:hypothetical protein [Bradyrhizobium sp. 63_E2_N1_3]|uniref:hypothetical protein n=1 Tax=Bradyrhizobium sp. 63_E2_N1_3 TaxID=3240373 RepID=UPI003F8B76CD